MNAEEDIINIKNLPMDLTFILDTSIQEAFSSGNLRLESLRRDYGMRIIPFNTVGKLTSKKLIQKGLIEVK